MEANEFDATVIHSVRHRNVLRLFDEFVRQTVRTPEAATLRGLERRFAAHLKIHPTYWSQIKSRNREIGERLARRFEELCRKPDGWMDRVPTEVTVQPPAASLESSRVEMASDAGSMPRDEDERFVVGLVLSYYRRHPRRAAERLLGLLGEALTASPGPPGLAGAEPVDGQPLESSLAVPAHPTPGPTKR